jgi:hypothetical protein
MKVKLLKRQKEGEAGEIVEVSPDRAEFFFSVEVAEPVKEAREQAVKPEPKTESKAVKKTAAKKK